VQSCRCSHLARRLQKICHGIATWDGLHPNDAGYAVMEPLAEKAIDAALKQGR